jgi:hypothetical protein
VSYVEKKDLYSHNVQGGKEDEELKSNQQKKTGLEASQDISEKGKSKIK